ncbi:MAG: outer membrane protein assembly factor BamE [Candidatus Accumulibacter meliphilus]|jgi:outer membrane protein assembly factor BamE|uniref:Outer membrane protein assembly factor BamE n=1 Tax=Candidatus Accumulibacter meliphilus TaxID=2211374 RepID=A0A369XY36_9PROT|nr:MAG: outer membrane protein assembly factor BamE [Candidatus Accumulibacter meliphilus]
MTFPRFATASLVLCVVSACSEVPHIITEYRIDVQQGNVLTQDMVSQLRPGLTKDQVRFILGTPVLVDMFHAQRWDYFYSMKKGNSSKAETRNFVVYFDDEGKLVRVTGDVAPATPTDGAALPETRIREIDLGSLTTDGSATVPPPDEDGFFGKILESVGL